jgi:hypothetical protein
MKSNLINLLILTLLGLTFSASVASADKLVRVIKVSNMGDYRVGQTLPGGTIIKTQANQRIALRTPSGDNIVVGSNSELVIKKLSWFKQLFGKIFYFFKKRDDNASTVETNTATIGIRGTSFLINSDDNTQSTRVALDTGELEIESPDDEPFKVHKPPALSEFEAYKQQVDAAINQISENYKTFEQGVESEFVEFKKSVLLSAGQTLELRGRDLVMVNISNSDQAELDTFKSYLNDVE